MVAALSATHRESSTTDTRLCVERVEGIFYDTGPEIKGRTLTVADSTLFQEAFLRWVTLVGEAGVHAASDAASACAITIEKVKMRRRGASHKKIDHGLCFVFGH